MGHSSGLEFRGPRWLKQCLLVLQSRAAAYMTRGNVCGGGKVSPNDWRLRQLRNYEVSCDAVWIWSLVPQTRTFNGASLTARCSVTARQYTACLPHPFHTLSAPNTFYLYYIHTHTLTLVWLNYPSSFQTAFLHSIQLQFDFFFFFLLTSSAAPIWFLFYISSVWQPFFF